MLILDLIKKIGEIKKIKIKIKITLVFQLEP